MLEKLRIQNFKSWQDTGDIAFGSLTGFFGTNSSGKSSILQFLLMLKQTVESSDRSRVLHLGDDKSYVDLGTMDDVIHNHTEPNSFFFYLTWALPKTQRLPIENYYLTSYSGTHTFKHVTFRAQIDKLHNTVSVYRFQFDAKDWKAGLIRQPSSDYQIFVDSLLPYDPEKAEEVALPKPIKFYAFPVEAKRLFPNQSFFDELASEFETLFGTIYYLGPIRDYPRRTYLWGGDDTADVGQRGERAIVALLASSNRKPTINMGKGQPKRTVEEHVAHWLKELGLIYSFKVQPIAPNRKEYEVRIQRTAESASVFLTDVGFGVSQILPVLVLLFYVPEGSTVILEQPEIHLHPAVQAGLADVFIDAIKRRKLQIVLESHSEHLLQRLQRRIAEEIIDEEAIKLYFTSIKEGRSELTTLELDEYGNIHNWPAGFFGNAFEEAAAKMKAEMKRKLREQQS